MTSGQVELVLVFWCARSTFSLFDYESSVHTIHSTREQKRHHTSKPSTPRISWIFVQYSRRFSLCGGSVGRLEHIIFTRYTTVVPVDFPCMCVVLARTPRVWSSRNGPCRHHSKVRHGRSTIILHRRGTVCSYVLSPATNRVRGYSTLLSLY
jgi:hypothetical protein